MRVGNEKGIQIEFRGVQACLIACGVATLVSIFSFSYGLFAWIAAALVFFFTNCLYVVGRGNAAYVLLLGELQKRILGPGWHAVCPLIAVVTELNTKAKEHPDTITGVETQGDGFKMDFEYTIYFGYNKDLFHLIPDHLNTPFEKTYFHIYLQEVLKNEVSKFSSKELNGEGHANNREVLCENVKVALWQKIETEFTRMCGTADVVTNYDLVITNFIYSETFLQLREEERREEMNTRKAEEKKKQTELLAEAKKIATIKEAEGVAEGLRLKGASENEVKEALGKILAAHPEINRNELAKNFPKVFGGGTMVNLGDMLGEKPVTP